MYSTVWKHARSYERGRENRNGTSPSNRRPSSSDYWPSERTN
ncbi:hypothetical protein ZOD2009_14646 [Haladaptatus paucihalophilus DX253]|uniref:Uncharacterized protein n=1 Tax=Haladaptatus paucihalophilus DX253 TaxID=797209 RepID=E7QVU3_HALPU|nr:hypothetical protein ZOD2009_14646 [Haladaptatus paucihalophilus DX253]